MKCFDVFVDSLSLRKERTGINKDGTTESAK